MPPPPLRCALLTLLIFVSASACGGVEDQRERVTVFAAASLVGPMRSLERAYEAEHPGVDVVPSFAGSQVLAAQLVEGAPAQLFLSADAEQLDRVADARELGMRRVFASNAIVMVVAKGSELGGVEALSRSELALVMAGPEVPAGRYARAALKQLGLLSAAEAQLVSNEIDVRGVVTKVRSGQADAGMAYITDVLADPRLEARALPAHAAIEAHYELALILGPQGSARAAEEFAEYLSGESGQAIFAEHGFGPPS